MLLSDSIFSFLYGCQPLHKHNTSKSSEKPNHDRASKKIKQLKTIERRDFRKAKKHGALVNKFKALAQKIFAWYVNKARIPRSQKLFLPPIHQT